MKQTPILLLTGYLGSGKTTLVNHILTNEQNIKFAVIVNDLGEVNIDASLIQKGGIVGQKDESLVALQNGCICCTLKMDLIEQLNDIMKLHRFDYIVIEASGICEPEPIAQTICSIPSMGPEYMEHGIPRLHQRTLAPAAAPAVPGSRSTSSHPRRISHSARRSIRARPPSVPGAATVSSGCCPYCPRSLPG